MQREEWIHVPKIELHCHLDGSLSERALRRMVKDADCNVQELTDSMRVKSGQTDLADYLSCFGNAMPFLQSAGNLEIAAYELVREASEENVVYMEVRFAPMYHGQEGLSQRDAVKAVLRGLEAAERDFGTKSRLLLCMMRGKPQRLNEETLSCAAQMRGYGVAGVDLAGREEAYPPQLSRELFRKARELQLPFTVHAGECGSAENVRVSIEMGARRIGHGVAIADDEEVKALCRSRGIPLEMCPVSNLQTGAVKQLCDYPWERLRREGVRVTINTDNRTVSDTSLVREWQTLEGAFGPIGVDTLLEAAECAADAAFLPWAEREELKKRLKLR